MGILISGRLQYSVHKKEVSKVKGNVIKNEPPFMKSLLRLFISAQDWLQKWPAEQVVWLTHHIWNNIFPLKPVSKLRKSNSGFEFPNACSAFMIHLKKTKIHFLKTCLKPWSFTTNPTLHDICCSLVNWFSYCFYYLLGTYAALDGC